MIITVHTIFGIVALLSGAWNLFAVKGTRQHQRIGLVYAISMYGLILTSFFIYELFGGFGVFHVLAIVSGVTLTLALYFPLRRHTHSNWLVHHYFWISYSYIGLVMATGSHFFGYFPDTPFIVRALLFWAVPYVAGTAMVYGLRDRTLMRLQPRISEFE